jgi:predicted DCC family thiol-disulfide oxidoreductase YuxK
VPVPNRETQIPNKKSKSFIAGYCIWISSAINADSHPLFPALARDEVNTERNRDAVLVVAHGRSLQKSAAVIAVLNSVGGGWKLAALLLGLLPRSIADKIYDWIAAHRYQWFGRRDTCFVPRRGHEPDQLPF